LIYEYRCRCGKEKDVVKPLSEYSTPEVCECGENMRKIISAPRVLADIEPYKSIVTGERIGGRAHHKKHLKEHNLIEVGNENIERQETKLPDVVPDIKRAIQELRNG